MKFIDISGVGSSGKSAVGDVLREIDGIHVPHFQFEFDFIRVRGGLLDMRNALQEDWSPVRSHAAYNEFLRVASTMGINPKPWDIVGIMNSTSQRYDRAFSGQFLKLTQNFAQSLVVGSYRASWPYDGLTKSPLSRLISKLAYYLRSGKHIESDVLLLDGADFDAKAEKYLNALYAAIVPDHKQVVVLNNGLEPFNPLLGLSLLGEGARQIIVLRDPRDIYVSGQNPEKMAPSDKDMLAFDNKGNEKSFLAADDLELFVKRYRLYNEQVYAGDDPRVLKVYFEDLVLNYTQTLEGILDFLGISSEQHVNKKKFFDPGVSSKGVGLWQRYSGKDELAYLERELGDYLYETAE